jgi:hypothetical protein|tara:strand:+ start:1630 stop:2130 length:501 start_codon:yes stop_codon:yes gene_type:complete
LKIKKKETFQFINTHANKEVQTKHNEREEIEEIEEEERRKKRSAPCCCCKRRKNGRFIVGCFFYSPERAVNVFLSVEHWNNLEENLKNSLGDSQPFDFDCHPSRRVSNAQTRLRTVVHSLVHRGRFCDALHSDYVLRSYFTSGKLSSTEIAKARYSDIGDGTGVRD